MVCLCRGGLLDHPPDHAQRSRTRPQHADGLSSRGRYDRCYLEDGRKRAAAEGLLVDFQEGDAEEIPFPDASFDYVLSTLGAMFAPDQEKTASELLRVCKRGGKIGMANFTPDSFAGQVARVTAKYLPPPLKPPFLWGTEERLRELFGQGVSSLEVHRRSIRLPLPFAAVLRRTLVGTCWCEQRSP